MKWRIFFLNIDKLSELRMAEYSLLHSEIVEGKKEFLKKLFFTLKMGMLYTFLQVWDECLTEIRWKRYWRCSFLKTLSKRQSFIYQSRSLRGCKPYSWYSFPLDAPLIVPVIARQALYWIHSSLSWKELLKVWSCKISP